MSKEPRCSLRGARYCAVALRTYLGERFMPDEIQGRIRAWTDLTKLLEIYRERSYLFRGENVKEGRELKPKAGRVGSEIGAARKVEYTFRDEQKAFVDFQKAARPYLLHE